MKKRYFLHPKFIPTWILLGLMYLIAFIPFKFQLLIAKPLGFLLKIILKKRYKIVIININKCFKNLNKQQRKKIINQHFFDFAMSLFEVANCFYMSSQRLKKIYQFTDIKILQKLIKNKKNIIILVGHFTTMIIAGRILADNFNFTDIYRPQNNKLFNAKMLQKFKSLGVNMIRSKDNKNIIKQLKNGNPIWYAPDQDLNVAKSIFVPFFGIQTNTITATAKLAKIANAKVIPFNFKRTNDGYFVSFSPVIENYPSGNDEKDAILINQILENQIKSIPSQYLWTHKRFKTRPQGEKSFYL